MNAAERGRLLNKLADAVEAHKDELAALESLLAEGGVKEVILATNTTVEGEATAPDEGVLRQTAP